MNKTTLLSLILAASTISSYGKLVITESNLTITDEDSTYSSNFTNSSTTNYNNNNNQGGSFAIGTSASSGIENTTIIGDFENNKSIAGSTVGYSYGGAIFNWGTNTIVEGDFTNNYTYSYSASGKHSAGGAIFNRGGSISVTGGDFVGNFVVGMPSTGTTTTYVEGGAIANNSAATSFTLDATDNDILINGNFAVDINSFDSTAAADDTVYYGVSNGIANGGTMYFKTGTGSIIINDAITAYDGSGTIDISGTGLVEINNAITGQEITVSSGTLKLGSYEGGYSHSATVGTGTKAVNISYTQTQSTASLTDVKLTVAEGATLTVDAGKTVELTTSSITFDENSIFAIDITDFDPIDALSGICLIETIDGSSSITLSSLSDFQILDGDSVISITDGNNTYGDYEWILSLDTSDTTTSLILTTTSIVVPEPSTYAAIFGALALGLAFYRRRK